MGRTAKHLDTTPTHLKFGYEHVQETKRIVEYLKAKGLPHDVFSIEDERRRIHAYDVPLTYKQRGILREQRARRELEKRPKPFTKEELLRIAESFESANDPELIAIRDKAQALAGEL